MKKTSKFSFVGGVLILLGLSLIVIRWFAYIPNISWEAMIVVSVSIILALSGVCLLILPFLKEDDQLKHMAFHDPLTGVGNRNKLERHLNEILAMSSRKHENFAIIILDLDHFKNINDSIGHDAGDVLLQIIAERLQNSVRDSDVVARLGGDEFMIVITNVKDSDAVAEICHKILNNVSRKLNIQGHEIYTTTSIGICMYPHDGLDTETLIKNADLALYRAKEVGRNNYQFFTPEMTHKAQERMARQTALNHALIREEFVLYYQPSFDVSIKRIKSVEALLRWDSKDYGFLTPDSFMSIAEESGLIVPLGDWILRSACKQIRDWQTAGCEGLTMSVNFSARQFKQADFTDKIKKILRETQVTPQTLVLEITESLIMQDPNNARIILTHLKNMGVTTVIDNFGTGFSSFGYLKDFPVDKIKIDKTFIRNITTDSTNISLIAAILAMANKLKIKVIVEGVETKDQYELLLREGCTEFQGFYIAKPMPTKQMYDFLKKMKVMV